MDEAHRGQIFTGTPGLPYALQFGTIGTIDGCDDLYPQRGVLLLSQLDTILEFNEAFIAERAYEPLRTDRLPKKQLAVLSCMDTRLLELLPRSMNLHNGDAKIIKTAGALIGDPFDSTMRSLLVGIYELGVEEVLVVGHYGCGMAGINADTVLGKMAQRGIAQETITTLGHAGVDLHRWLAPLSSIPDSVAHTVETIRNHPLVPPTVPVHGLVIDPETGKLDLVNRDPKA